MRVIVPVLLALCPFFAMGDTDWQPLYNRADPELQARLEQDLYSNPAWKSLIQRKKLAVGLVDLSGDAPRFARVNGSHMMYAASLPKIAILLTA